MQYISNVEGSCVRANKLCAREAWVVKEMNYCAQNTSHHYFSILVKAPNWMEWNGVRLTFFRL